MKNSQNEEIEMNVTFWRVMTYRDGANHVRVDVLLKWKLASWKVKGRVFVPPLPESLDEIKERIRTAITSVTAFRESLGESSKTLGDYNQEQRTSL